MTFSIQPTLEDENFRLVPLKETDFERTFKVASDPKIWEQHPNPDRYKRDVFQNFFRGAIESGGALLVLDKTSDEVLGCTRFYDFDAENRSILIGYTFYGTCSWGKNVNPAVKKLMLDYIFRYVDKVIFHVGNENFRSIRAMIKLGAKNGGEVEVAYFGEKPKTNILFAIRKEEWLR